MLNIIEVERKKYIEIYVLYQSDIMIGQFQVQDKKSYVILSNIEQIYPKISLCAKCKLYTWRELRVDVWFGVCGHSMGTILQALHIIYLAMFPPCATLATSYLFFTTFYLCFQMLA